MNTLAYYQNILKYANVQVAAESFLTEDNGKPLDDKEEITKRLTEGNHYNTFFTEINAVKFAEEWTIVDQQPNTSSGFSATLFKNKTTNEYVVSFRSTEFIHDYIHDNFVTNRCISEHGWAFAQISDMIEWWENKIENIEEVKRGFERKNVTLTVT